MSICIIAYPFSGLILSLNCIGLINILVYRHFPLRIAVQPVPCITCRIIDFLPSAFESLTFSSFIPVSCPLFLLPLQIPANARLPVKNTWYSIYLRFSFCHRSGRLVKIVCTSLRHIPAFYHFPTGIIAHPFPGAVLTVCIRSCP